MLRLVTAGLASLVVTVVVRRTVGRRGDNDVWHEATKPADLR